MADLAGDSVPRPTSPRMMIVTLAACGVVVALMQTIIAPLLPELPRLAHTDLSTASWMVTSTLIAGCVANPVFGRIGDMYGKRRMILVSLLSMSVGSVLCGVSSDITTLVVGRTLQGAALALIPLGISILRDELAPEQVPGAVAVVSGTLGTGAAFGFPFAAFLVQYANWHAMFWVAGAVGLIDMFLVLRFVPESPRRSGGRFDVAGAVGLAAVLVSLLVGVDKGVSWGWTSPRTLSCFVLASVAAVAWARWETRARSPLVDIAVSAQPAVFLTNLVALLIGFSFYANSLSTAQLVQEPRGTGYGLGESIVVAGLCILPGGLLQAGLAPVVARMARTRGPRSALSRGALIMAGGYVYRLAFSHSVVHIVVGTTLVSCGTALVYSTLPLLIMQSVPPGETAAANGLNTLTRSVGQSVCSAVVASVLASITVTLAHGGTTASLRAYQTIFVIAGACALIAFVVTLRIPVQGRPTTQPAPRAGRRVSRRRSLASDLGPAVAGVDEPT